MIIVSNRLPLQIKIGEGKVESVPSVGGLATGIKSIKKNEDTLWVGWPGLAEEAIPCDHLKDDMVEQVIQEGCIPVSLTQYDLRNYYNGFCNNTLWALFHYFGEYAKYSPKTWESYQSVNKKFAEEVLDYAQKEDIVWVHDYQLMLVPQYIKEKRPGQLVGFFLHIPFPSYEVFRTLPCREALLQGLLCADLIGFHTHDYKEHFLRTVAKLLDVDIHDDGITHEKGVSRVGCFPMGIDVEKFETAPALDPEKDTTSSLQKELAQYKKAHPEVALILSIDRMDYTKGIPHRLRAFAHFLEKHPHYREKVRLLMLAVPSRSGIPQYQQLKKEVDELVGKINGRYGTIGWTPIWYFYRELPFTDLVKLYRSCPIALLTPLRDGMNLVAKEYIAARGDDTGTLILSELAGASKEMGEALLINPNNYEEVSTAIATALTMPPEKQKERNKKLRERLKQKNVFQWARNFLADLKQWPATNLREAKYLDATVLQNILKEYTEARHCAFLLDYDGTLVEFKNRPEEAFPDAGLMDLIAKLSSIPKNDVTLISGRDKYTMGTWFKNLRMTVVAEHGSYLRECYRYDWKPTGMYDREWMPHGRRILQQFVDRTHGSFIEEKSHSLAWHYRMAEEKVGEKHAKELFSHLVELAQNQNLQVIHGHKVVELVNSDVNKGVAAEKLLMQKQADFIVAIGDDRSDEFMFRKLRNRDYTVKVGTSQTSAKYYVNNTREVRSLLRKFVAASRRKKCASDEKPVNGAIRPLQQI